jgi:hypothetical protein
MSLEEFKVIPDEYCVSFSSRLCDGTDITFQGWKMTANDFPAFLWSGDPPRNEYNEDAMTKVLFKDYVLERVSRHLFTIHQVSH